MMEKVPNWEFLYIDAVPSATNQVCDLQLITDSESKERGGLFDNSCSLSCSKSVWCMLYQAKEKFSSPELSSA